MSAAEWIAQRRELLADATDAPWVVGDRDHIQGASHCTCHSDYGPLVWEGRRDINGMQMMTHIHRAREPRYDDDTTVYSTSLPYPEIVALSTTEYGPIQPGNARLIADARTSLPRALDALEAVLGVVRLHRRESATDGSVDEHDYVGALADEIERTIESVLRGES